MVEKSSLPSSNSIHLLVKEGLSNAISNDLGPRPSPFVRTTTKTTVKTTRRTTPATTRDVVLFNKFKLIYQLLCIQIASFFSQNIKIMIDYSSTYCYCQLLQMVVPVLDGQFILHCQVQRALQECQWIQQYFHYTSQEPLQFQVLQILLLQFLI